MPKELPELILSSLFPDCDSDKMDLKEEEFILFIEYLFRVHHETQLKIVMSDSLKSFLLW